MITPSFELEPGALKIQMCVSVPLLHRICTHVSAIFMRRDTPSLAWQRYMAGVLEEWQWGCSATSGHS